MHRTIGTKYQTVQNYSSPVTKTCASLLSYLFDSIPLICGILTNPCMGRCAVARRGCGVAAAWLASSSHDLRYTLLSKTHLLWSFEVSWLVLLRMFVKISKCSKMWENIVFGLRLGCLISFFFSLVYLFQYLGVVVL